MATTLIGSEPRGAYRALERRATLLLVGTLLALGALAWWSTVERAGDMGGMSLGLGSAGTAMMPLDAGLFLAMWVTMMVAMMFPTIAPVVLLHRMVMRRSGAGVSTTVAFTAGYLAVWAVSGLVPLGVLLAVRAVAADAAWTARASGVVLIIAGLYQFSPWKQACQRACQSPITFLATHDFGHGTYGAARTGWGHGLYCVGCCWALMAVLFVVGLMNLAWMAAITVVFVLEKHLRTARLLSRLVGSAVTALGVVVLVAPDVLMTLSA
jgi:predicted metal-binding membrane protein